MKPKRCYGFESPSAIFFSFKRIYRICLIDEGHRNIIKRSIATWARKMPKKCSCIHASERYNRYFLYSCSIEIRNRPHFDLRIVPSILCKLINKYLLLQSKLWFILYVSWVTELVKIDVSLKFRHVAQRFP